MQFRVAISIRLHDHPAAVKETDCVDTLHLSKLMKELFDGKGLAGECAAILGVNFATPFEAQENQSLPVSEPVQILDRLRLLFVSQGAGRVETDLLMRDSEPGEPSLNIGEILSVLFPFEAD